MIAVKESANLVGRGLAPAAKAMGFEVAWKEEKCSVFRLSKSVRFSAGASPRPTGVCYVAEKADLFERFLKVFFGEKIFPPMGAIPLGGNFNKDNYPIYQR